MEKYILVLDAGTTNIKALLFNNKGEIVSQVRRKVEYIMNEPGQVEQDPRYVWELCKTVIEELLAENRITAQNIASMGITTQRSSFLFWNKKNGQTYSPIITWQDKRAADYANKASNLWWVRLIRLIARFIGIFIKTGKLIVISILKFDTVHSSVRTSYFLKNNRPLFLEIQKANTNVVWGTVDSWLLWNLTDEKLHVTDYSSISSTGLFDPFTLKWNRIVLKLFNIPVHILPEVRETGGDFGTTSLFGGGTIPVKAVFADQQASLFGQCCFQKGDMKCTNGTGSFIDLNTGTKACASQRRLYPLVAWKYKNSTYYMLEGQSANTGNIIDWLEKELQFISSPDETAELAGSVASTGGLFFLPAFTTGLTFPYWDSTARGNFFGLSLQTKKGHIIRAILEGLCYRIKDIVDGITRDSGIGISRIKLDGGVSNNRFLLQFLANILGVTVEHYRNPEATALGAAFMTGLACGYWESPDQLVSMQKLEDVYEPLFDEQKRKALYKRWQDIVRRSLKYRVYD